MSRKPVSAKTILGLLTAGLVLPIIITVVLAVAALLDKMSDAAGGLALRYVALVCGIVWVVVLVSLVLVQALNMLSDTPPDDHGETDG